VHRYAREQTLLASLPRRVNAFLILPPASTIWMRTVSVMRGASLTFTRSATVRPL
jgi:hypothetical protein